MPQYEEEVLGAAEPERRSDGIPGSYAGDGEPLADGDSERIHGDRDGNEQGLNNYRNHDVMEGSSSELQTMGLDQRSHTPPTPS